MDNEINYANIMLISGLPLFEESSKIVPRIFFRGIFYEDSRNFRGIPRGIFKYMFDHFVMIFKLLVFLYDKFNDSKYNFMSIFLIMLFRKYMSFKYLNLEGF